MDFTTDELIDLKTACERFPSKPDISSLWRWMLHGLGGVKLRYVRSGRKMHTTEKWITQFMEQLAARDAERFPPPPASKHRSARQRKRDIEAADKALQEAGV